jgi:hypothetical protein
MVEIGLVKIEARGIEPWVSVFMLMRRLGAHQVPKRQNFKFLRAQVRGHSISSTTAHVTGTLGTCAFLHVSAPFDYVGSTGRVVAHQRHLGPGHGSTEGGC